jgi:hypothetical protein
VQDLGVGLVAIETDTDLGAGFDETGGNAVADYVHVCEKDNGAVLTASGVNEVPEVFHGRQRSDLLLCIHGVQTQRRRYNNITHLSNEEATIGGKCSAIQLNETEQKKKNKFEVNMAGVWSTLV